MPSGTLVQDSGETYLEHMFFVVKPLQILAQLSPSWHCFVVHTVTSEIKPEHGKATFRGIMLFSFETSLSLPSYSELATFRSISFGLHVLTVLWFTSS